MQDFVYDRFIQVEDEIMIISENSIAAIDFTRFGWYLFSPDFSVENSYWAANPKNENHQILAEGSDFLPEGLELPGEGADPEEWGKLYLSVVGQTWTVEI